ncbi:MAG: hypothetical protein BWY82_02145 [Verrucomicrobia bacterium ADurb.Bin474]|nr:MAG: hypothetical protein BWY82_02145 [Verrucomicrobia bacterium ADurb.Bin474]
MHCFRIQVIGRLVQKKDVGFLEEQARERHPAAFPAGKVVNNRIRRGAAQSVHRHFHLSRQIPCIMFVEFRLQPSLTICDFLLLFRRLRRCVGFP